VKKYTALVLVALALLAAPAFAQSNLLGDLQAARGKYPTPMSAAQQAALLNEVAAKHKAEGWGLLAKPSGNNCPQPTTGILVSCDWLVHLPSGTGVDALRGSETEGTPQWGGLEPFDKSRFVAPVAPADQPGGGGTIDPPPPPPPANDAQLEELKKQTFWLEKIAGRQAETNANLKALRAELQKALADLKSALLNALPLLLGLRK